MNESETSVGTNVAEAEQGIAANRELLPLDLAERVVVLRMRESGAIRRHIFRRIERADVVAYFSATVVATERRGQTSFDEIDIGSAELKLYARAIIRVEGYKLNGGLDLMELSNWRERIPGGHRIRAADILMKISKSVTPDEQFIDPEFDAVSLDACWTEKEGTMSQWRGLVHRFTPPTVAHWRKLNNFRTSSVAIRGSRTHRTTYPKVHGLFEDLYNELAVSVDGYSFRGAALDDRETVIAQMDTFHKCAAISALFDKSESDDLAEETEEK